MSHAKLWPIVWLVIVAWLVACAHHPRFYSDAEERLRTGEHFNAQGHFAAYHPNAIALSSPDYVVGIELGEKVDVVRGSDFVVDRVVHAGTSMAFVSNVLIDGPRVPVVSHVMDVGLDRICAARGGA